MSSTGSGRPQLQVELVLIVGALSAFAPLSIDMYLPGLPEIAHGAGCIPRPRCS